MCVCVCVEGRVGVGLPLWLCALLMATYRWLPAELHIDRDVHSVCWVRQHWIRLEWLFGCNAVKSWEVLAGRSWWHSRQKRLLLTVLMRNHIFCMLGTGDGSDEDADIWSIVVPRTFYRQYVWYLPHLAPNAMLHGLFTCVWELLL